MCYAPLVMLRGRYSCAISGLPTSSPASKNPLSPIIPVDPGNSPVSPVIPVHTQKQGGGGHLSHDAFSSNSFVFSRRSNYMLNYMNIYIVGAPTFVTLLTRVVDTFKSGPPPKFGPYTSCELSTMNCAFDSLKRAFYRELIKIVGAPTFVILLRTTRTPKNRSEDRPLHVRKCGPPQKDGPYNGKMTASIVC